MRNKNFYIIVIGQIISLFGNAIQRFSMSLYLLHLTGSATVFANILAVSTVPYVIFAPIAGKLSDSVDKKKIMVFLDFFCFFIILLYAFLLDFGNNQVILAGIIMFLLSVCSALYGPAVTSSISLVVKGESLTRANGIINQVGSMVNFLGPILAGILYGFAGIKLIIIINAVSFLLSALMELFLSIPNELDENRNIISLHFFKEAFIEMKDTFLYLKKYKKIVLGIILSYGLCNIFVVPILSVVAPYFINVFLGLSSQVYGIVEAICVCGMILGGFFISIKPDFFSIKKIEYTYFPMITGILLMCLLGFISVNGFIMAGVFALGGMGIMMTLALSNVVTLTFIQKDVEGNILGRVSALSTAFATITVAPGQILFGRIIDMGTPMAVVFLITLVMTISLVIFVKQNTKKVKYSVQYLILI